MVTSSAEAAESGLRDLGNGSMFIDHLRTEHAGAYYCVLEPLPDIHKFTLTVVPQRPSPEPTQRVEPYFNIGKL